MPKLKGPLFSLGAHGTVAKTLTYSKRKSGQQVRNYNKPTKAATPKQRGQRRLTEFLVAQWQNMSDVDKATWDANARVSGLNLPGYQYFLREAQRDLYTHHGLCNYWHCNEIVGGEILDISGKANHGALEPSYPANAPSLVDSAKTKFSKALSYDGVDEYVDFGHHSIWNFGIGPFTLSGLLWIDGDQDNKHVIAKWDWVSTVRGFSIKIDPGPILTFTHGNGSSSHGAITGVLPLGAWIQFDGVKEGSKASIYINGAHVDTTTDQAYNIDNSTPLAFGARIGPDNFFKGYLDEVCIYNRALSAIEIAARFRLSQREVG